MHNPIDGAGKSAQWGCAVVYKMAAPIKKQVFAPKWNNIDIMAILGIDTGFSKRKLSVSIIVDGITLYSMIVFLKLIEYIPIIFVISPITNIYIYTNEVPVRSIMIKHQLSSK